MRGGGAPLHGGSFLLGVFVALLAVAVAPRAWKHLMESPPRSFVSVAAGFEPISAPRDTSGSDFEDKFETIGKQKRALVHEPRLVLPPSVVGDKFEHLTSWPASPLLCASQEHTFAIITDKDHNSNGPDEGEWHAILRQGTLHLDASSGNYSVTWQGDTVLRTRTATKGRSMELSELVQYRHLLFAFCDSTGLVWKVQLPAGEVLQRYAIADGDGEQPKAFKSEWATVKDGLVWVGSMGRPYVLDDGTVLHRNAEWVKTLDENGRIENHNWAVEYAALRKAAEVEGLGYLWHEAVHWDAPSRQWFFLPRKRSLRQPYTSTADETRGTNILLVASEDFSSIRVLEGIGPAEDDYGFSSIRSA